MDFTSRKHYENTRRALREILEEPVTTIPIINENDTVATEELTFGDNDKLAGYVARMMRARLLVLLTTKKGLLADVDKPESLIRHIDPWKDDWSQYIRKETTPNGTGGMGGKCCAAAKVARHRSYAVIADGTERQVLKHMILEKKRMGTLFSLDGEEEPWAKIHQIQHPGSEKKC
jgi:glutamate 5-kinase